MQSRNENEKICTMVEKIKYFKIQYCICLSKKNHLPKIITYGYWIVLR